MESSKKDNSNIDQEPEALMNSIDFKDNLSESQYVEIGSPSSNQGKVKSGKRKLNPFGKQNKKEVSSHIQEKRSYGISPNKSPNDVVSHPTHQSDQGPYRRTDQEVSPSFSTETAKEINYLTFSAPNLDRYESFKKYLQQNSQSKQQSSTHSSVLHPASLTDRLMKDDAKDECKCENTETCPHTKYGSAGLRSERSHLTFNMRRDPQSKTIDDPVSEHPTPKLKMENICQDDSMDSNSSPQNLEEATQKALQNLSFKLGASQSSEHMLSHNTSVNSDLYRTSEAKDSKDKYLTPNLSEIKRSSLTNEFNMLLHRPSQQSEFMNTDIVLNISTLTANNSKMSSRKESNVERIKDFVAQRAGTPAEDAAQTLTLTKVESLEQRILANEQNFNRNNFASITSSTGYKSQPQVQKRLSQAPQEDENKFTPEHLLKFAEGEIEPNSFNELSFSMDNPLPEKLSISSPERLHTEPSSIRNDSNLFGTNSEIIRNHSPDNCEKHTLQLNGATKNINVRTFLMLRSLIKPNENILLCCQAFVKLFAGLSEAIPSSFSIMDKIEWGNIKVLFNAPLKILNLIASFTSFVEFEKIPERNINAALSSLSKIPYEINKETQNEAFYQMYEYVVSAIEFYKYYKPGTLYTPKRKRSPVQDYHRIIQTEADYIQDSPPVSTNISKSPLKSSTRNQNLSTMASQRWTKTSASPLRDTLSSRRTPLEDRSARTANSSMNGSKSATRFVGAVKKPVATAIVKSKAKEQTTKNAAKPQGKSKIDTYLKNLLSNRQNAQTQETAYTEGDQDYITERARTLEPGWVESSRLHSETERKKKEAIEFRGKTGRLLADHERYVKRLMKARSEAEDELDRELKLQERERLEEYIEYKNDVDRSHDRQLENEKIQAKRETKTRQARAEQESINDDIVENMKHHCFLSTQNEKKKFDRKKQLWEQYKNILAEKMAKKKTASKEAIQEKQDISRSRIDEYIWKKQQATTERDKWVNNFITLSKLIGNAR